MNGYDIGVGSSNAPQAEMAFDFYNAVKAQLGSDSNISVTGHSMGGGIAGLVGAVYGKGGYIFENMAFSDAATSLVNAANLLPAAIYDSLGA